MIKILGITFGILNVIAGCTAGIILVEITGNPFYLIINGITGFTGGMTMAMPFVLQELGE